ncbi:MAG: hypothetical protein K8R64_03345 [Methanosarcinaceae archaeon]|nr:hypothetical protein [Methanosarcinaceae archaeon]
MANKNKMFFALAAGILYVLFGCMQIVEQFGIKTGLAELLLIPGDIFGGLCLVVIGAVFLYGAKELNSGMNMGVSYVYVGILMSLVFMAVYVLIIGASLLEVYLIQNEDYLEWRIIDDIRPGLYLGFLSLAGYVAWRGRFSLPAAK